MSSCPSKPHCVWVFPKVRGSILAILRILFFGVDPFLGGLYFRVPLFMETTILASQIGPYSVVALSSRTTELLIQNVY